MIEGSPENTQARTSRAGCCAGGCLSGAFFLTGLVLILAAGFLGFRSFERVNSSASTEGTVIDLRSNGEGSFQPVISYTVDGVDYRIVASVARSPAPDIGDSVGVLFDPDNPADGIERTFLELWGVTAILGGMGLIFATIGMFAFFAGRKIGKAVGPIDLRPIEFGTDLPPPSGEPVDLAPPAIPPDTTPQMASYRRVESAGPDQHGTFSYRIIGRLPDGTEVSSISLETDPTLQVIERGNYDFDVAWDGSSWVIDTSFLE